MVLLNQCLRMGLEELCCFRWDLKARPLAVSRKAFPALQLVCYGLKGGLHPKQLCSGRCLHKRQLCFQDVWGVGVPGGRDECRAGKAALQTTAAVFQQDRERKRQLEPKLQPAETRSSGQQLAPRYNTHWGRLALNYSTSLGAESQSRSQKSPRPGGSRLAACSPSALCCPCSSAAPAASPVRGHRWGLVATEGFGTSTLPGQLIGLCPECCPGAVSRLGGGKSSPVALLQSFLA